MRTVLIVLTALWPTLALANFLDESDCKSGRGVVFNTAEAISVLDRRIVACFNHQQKLARERDQEYRSIIMNLQRRLEILETESLKKK